MPRPGIVGMRGSTVLRVWLCMKRVRLPPCLTVPPTLPSSPPAPPVLMRYFFLVRTRHLPSAKRRYYSTRGALPVRGFRRYVIARAPPPLSVGLFNPSAMPSPHRSPCYPVKTREFFPQQDQAAAGGWPGRCVLFGVSSDWLSLPF